MNETTITNFVTPVMISLKIAVMATIVAFIFGGGLAWLLSRRNGFWANILEVLVSLPLVFPPTVVGFYLLTLFGRSGFLGGIIYHVFKANLIFTPAAAIIAAATAAMPFMFKTLKSFFECVDPDTIGAARLDGATEWILLRDIRLPLAAKGVLAGITLSFLRALGEFGATLMVAGNIPGKTQTLSVAIWGWVMSGEPAKAHMLALLLAAISIIAVTGLRFIDKKLDGWDFQTSLH